MMPETKFFHQFKMMSSLSSPHAGLLTVSELTQAIKRKLESSFSFVCLQGEVSNLKLQSSGHLYFSLKDAQAQIAVVMFRGELAYLKTLPKVGDQVIVKGELTVYPPKGNYQLVVRELSLTGLGELLQRLEQLKMKLHQQGWFKTARKKPLPAFPRCIGVITSPTGAVIQDILNILSRRFSGFHLLLNPVKVQGEGAAQEIAKAIQQFNHYHLVDVMIIGRGGGSLEDLWAFNEEIVAEAIYHSQIPIISAVGHETDHCIADYVADVRAPTPSAAAEIVVGEKKQYLDALKTLRQRLHQRMQQLLKQYAYYLTAIRKHPLLIHPHTLLEWREQKLDHYRMDLNQAFSLYLQSKKHLVDLRAQLALSLKPINKILHFKQRLAMLKHRLDSYPEQLKNYRQQLQHLSELFHAIDPKNLLEKGYTILLAEKEKSVIKIAHDLKKGQRARLLFADGEAFITINEVMLHEQR